LPRPGKGNLLRRGAAYVDDNFIARMELVMSRLGFNVKAKFVRATLKKRIEWVLEALEKTGAFSIAFLMFFLVFPVVPEAFRAAFAVLLAPVLCHFVVGLVRAESPEEQARAQRVLAGVVLGGAMMALAKPIAYWITGIAYDASTGTWYIGGKPADLPAELVAMVDRLLTLLMVIGVVVAIAGGIYAGIQLARAEEGRG
jgi:hypothetical protein